VNLHDTLLTLNAIQIVLRDSNRTEQIHIVEETTGRARFRRLLDELRGTEEGRALLSARPELCSAHVDYDGLRRLPADTLGGAYARHLDDNNLSAELQASKTNHVDDEDVAYLMRRFRQTHDVWHPMTALGPAPHEEVTIHAFSYGQLQLPVSALIVSLGGIKHGALERRWRLCTKGFRDAYRIGKEAKPLMGVYWEKMWGDPLLEVRRRYNVRPVDAS
jgi:ubiquinone biosynthesis protein COQ4